VVALPGVGASLTRASVPEAALSEGSGCDLAG